MQHFLDHPKAPKYACGIPVPETANPHLDTDSAATTCRNCVARGVWRNAQTKAGHALMGAEVIPSTWTVDTETLQPSGEVQLFFRDGWIRLVRVSSYAEALAMAPILWRRHQADVVKHIMKGAS